MKNSHILHQGQVSNEEPDLSYIRFLLYTNHMTETKNNALDVPRAIIIAGIIIAGAILLTQVKVQERTAPQADRLQPQIGEEDLENVLPLSEEDHVRGILNAPITVIEYSDFECPFCKRFHATMTDLMAAYDGKVAWVYRHYPLESLHPVKARLASIASECIAKQKGEKGFWFFADRYYELSESNNITDTARVIAQIAGEMEADMNAFNTCVTNEETASKVDRDVTNAFETGGQGTPWSIIITSDGRKYPVNGAYPLEAMKQMIDQILSE